MIYYYDWNKPEVDLAIIHDLVNVSILCNKVIQWCRWDEDELKLQVSFLDELTAPEKEILDNLIMTL